MRFQADSVAQSSLVWIGGEDSAARVAALKAVLEASRADDTETESFSADSKDIESWLAAACTMPFFSDRRVVIVRNIGRFDPEDKWDAPINKSHPAVGLFTSVPESSLMLLVHDDDTGAEDRQRRQATVAGQWSKLVDHAGGKSLKFDVDLSQTPGLVRSRAKELGKKISEPAVSALIEMVAGKPSLALAEVEKLALYVGDEPEIRERDVRESVAADTEYNVFRLIDAIVGGQTGEALTQIRTMFGQTTDLQGQAFPRVFPILTGQLRTLWQARFLLDSGTNPSRPGSEVEAWLPSKRLSSEPDWKRDKTLRLARRLTLGQIGECLSLLVRADAELKGALPAAGAGESIERLTLDMCRVCATRN